MHAYQKIGSDKSHAVVYVTGTLICLVFFGILVRPGTDMVYIFLHFFLYCLFPYYKCVLLIILFLFYVLLLHYMLLLFPLSGSSYCTVYLFIILIYTIVKLNVILLSCISIDSIACASYFIHCVILFDL